MYSNSYKPILEIKGNLLTLMVLHLFESDNEQIAEELVKKIKKAPEFFQSAPIIIDLYAIADQADINLENIIKLLKEHGLIPVAVRSANSQQQEVALTLNLGILTNTKSANQRRNSEPEDDIPKPINSKVIQQPVRSGQQVISLDGDLVILSMVSHGAEVLAHKHIHVYGALRGRALAGVNGDIKARIFCQQLDAELLSIAGRYVVNDDLPNELRGKPVQIYLEDDSVKIEAL
ncbi:MAG: septum site-determining protein MinC [Thiomargarita sp.]|nr:septum site-determining protein MinC [Thiomargarita sp.]